MIALFVQPPRAPGYRLQLAHDRVTIGRSAASDVRLPEDLSLSRHHAEIVRDGDRIVVRDLGSRNGTFVGGQPVGAPGLALRPGDAVSIGETLITLEPTAGASIEIGADVGMPQSTGTLILKVDDLFGRRGPSPAADGTPDPAAALARFGRHLAMFEAVGEAGNLLTADRPLAELLGAVLDRIFEMVPAERGAVVLLQGERLVPMATRYRDPSKAAEPIQIARGIADMAIRDRSAVSTIDAQADPRFSERASIRLAGIRAAVCAPLFTGKDVLGLLYVDSLVAESSFGLEDLTLLSTLAVLTAMKVENQRLLLAYLEKERLEREIDIAREISEALLPRAAPTVAGLEVFARNVPCRTIGGDYFDFQRDDGVLHVVIADVCGKGIPAALLMAALQASFRAYLPASQGPADLLSRLNEALVLTTPASKYATVFYARVDLATGRLRYCNAGHNPPVVLRAAGGSDELPKGGMICGMFEATSYTEGETELLPGDLLVLFTDGIPDEEAAGERLGVPAFLRWIEEDRHQPLQAIGPRVFERLDAFQGSASRFDDRTLVLLRRAGAP